MGTLEVHLDRDRPGQVFMLHLSRGGENRSGIERACVLALLWMGEFANSASRELDRQNSGVLNGGVSRSSTAQDVMA
jgi:hypothetical protein